MKELSLRKREEPLEDFVDLFRVSYKNKYINLSKVDYIIEEAKKNEYLKSFKT
jgi:hypothetical protein